MRHARFLSQNLRWIAAGWVVCLTGCTHNYYYGNAVPACPPGTIPATVTNGAVCEVPSEVNGGNAVAQWPARSSTTIVGVGSPLSGSRPPRVVVSQPSEGLLGRWRRSNPESSLATVSVEGNVDSPTSTR
jgi:hypothetical protein